MIWPQLASTDLDRTTTSTIDAATYAAAERIVADVRTRGEPALREHGVNFGDITADAPLVIPREALLEHLESTDAEIRSLLRRTADRIRLFAEAQRQSFSDCDVTIPGGTAGHRWLPLASAGCYAPGGRYPLPSSVLMTAVTARVAGVPLVWVASPRPSAETLAAAAIANADGLLTVGGAQAIAALAHGIDGIIPRCDVVVGPGNRYVTAAKALISRTTRIDMLAGPSELVVVASADANPQFVAADLLAQAEHDVDARPILITDDETFAAAVSAAITVQLTELPTADVATAALAGGGYLVVTGVDEALACCRRIAPEHLSLQGERFESAADQFDMGAALFIGPHSAEVLGDYGAGPNHVLPTGGAARAHSALSVATFMRFQTRLQITDPPSALALVADAAALGRLEGLAAHARSADSRLSLCE